MKEGPRVEFKATFNHDAIVTLSAFANTKGGTVHIGVGDDGRIIGVGVSDKSLEVWANEIKHKTEPSIVPNIERREIKGKSVVMLSVAEFPVKPVGVQGRYYRRVAGANHQMSVSEIADAFMQSTQESWDAYPHPGAEVKDLDLSKVRTFAQKVNAGSRFHLPSDPRQALVKLRLLRDGRPTHAAMLLFAKDDLRFNVHVGRFKTPDLIIDDKMLSGTLFDVVEATIRQILGHIRVALKIAGARGRSEEFEYPLPVIRELVLNAVVHRDYTSPIDVQIKVFDDGVTIFNPGRLFGRLTIEDLAGDDYQSSARNKLIAESFYLSGDIEKYGSGYVRMRKELRKYPGLEFRYQEKGNGFLAELWHTRSPGFGTEADRQTGAQTGAQPGARLTKKQEAVLELIRANPEVSFASASVLLGMTRDLVRKHFDALKRKGIIRHVGSTRSGRWVVVGQGGDFRSGKG